MKSTKGAGETPTPSCPTCRRSGTRECARLDCGNRRVETAHVDSADAAYEPMGEGCLRKRPTLRECDE